MRLAVIGSRGFDDYELLEKVLDIIQRGNRLSFDTIVSGGANGADSLAERYAIKNDIKTDIYPADWNKHGKSAGYIRNVDIWDNSDFGVAFWDGESKGTAHSFKLSIKQNKTLFIYNYSTRNFYLYKED